MSVIDRLPTLDEGKLAAIEQNAQRWLSTGTDKQKAEAESVLLAIAAERQQRLKKSMSGSQDGPDSTDNGPRENTKHRGFDAVWMNIFQRLQAGQTIRNWGVAQGYTGKTFQIEHVGNSTITVVGGSMTQSRKISKGDFERVYSVWDDYCAGSYRRENMTDLSQNTSYILSIFRQVI
jgi:hypothetical protein